MSSQTTSLSEDDITLLKMIAGSRWASRIGQALFSLPGLFLIVVPLFPATAKIIGVVVILIIHLIFSFYRRQRNRIYQDIRAAQKSTTEGNIRSISSKGSTVIYTIDRREVAVKLPTASYDYSINNIKTIGGPAIVQAAETSRTLLSIEYTENSAIQIEKVSSGMHAYTDMRKTLIITGSALALLLLMLLFDMLLVLLFWILSVAAVIITLIIYSVYWSELKGRKKSSLSTIQGTVTETFDFRIMAAKASLRYGQYVRIGPYLFTDLNKLKVKPGDRVSAKVIIPTGKQTGLLEAITVL